MVQSAPIGQQGYGGRVLPSDTDSVSGLESSGSRPAMVVHSDGLQLNQITSYGDEVHCCKSHPRHPGLIPPKEEIDIWIRENERVRCGGGSLVD